MSGPVAEAANEEDPAAFVHAARAQIAGATLRHDALRLVLQGRTSVQEAMRISTQLDDL
jgi:MSHA biogenesis protein MshE